MATYLELESIRNNAGIDDLMKRIAVAICIKANAIAKAVAATTEQKAWAKSALASPGTYQWTLLNFILAEYNAVTVEAILGASDAQVQAAVDSAVDTLLGA